MNTHNNPITPEDLDLIDHYLLGNMDESTRYQIEQRIAADVSFRDKVDEMRLLGIGIAEHQVGERLPAYHSGLQQAKEAPVRRMAWKKWAIAASVILLSAMTIWLVNRNSSENELFASYYRPDPGLVSAMGVSNNYRFDLAMIEYKRGNYAAAIATWDSLAKENPANDTLQYFLGSAKLAEGNVAASITHFEKVTASQKSAFASDAWWYIALARLKQDEKDKAAAALLKTEREEKKIILEKIK